MVTKHYPISVPFSPGSKCIETAMLVHLKCQTFGSEMLHCEEEFACGIAETWAGALIVCKLSILTMSTFAT